MKALRIISVIQRPQLRGAELFACHLAKALQALGHEVIIVCIFPGDAELPYDGELIKLNCKPISRALDLSGWHKLAKIIKTYKPDVVQANAGDTVKYAVLSRFVFRWKVPIVFRNASTISQYINSFGSRLYYKLLFSRVDYVISVCDYSRVDFLALFPFMQDRISVVPIGIVRDDAEKINESQPFLLHIGGFTFEKNHEGLLRIFSVISTNHPNLQLWLIGEGPLRSQIEKKVRDLGLERSVRFLGYKHSVLPYIKASSALVLPSVIEGLPSVIVEAMYCKIPVIAYAVGGIPELVKNDQTGWLVSPGNEPEFINKVQEVLQKKNTVKTTEDAYQMVIKEYLLDNIAVKFSDIYAGELTRINF